jgi:hypothetical protein
MFREDKYILISSFIDNELTDKEKQYVQNKIAEDPEWKSVYVTFLENKDSFASLKELYSDDNSKEAIMARIRKKKAGEYNSSFLSFPKRYVPAIAAILVAAIVLTSYNIIKQQSEVKDFIDKNANIAKSYYDNIFRDGNLYPLNASLSNQDVFRFAAFGIVSSESQKDQYVQIGDDDKSGLFVKITDKKAIDSNNMNLQLSEIFEKLNVDETQQKKIEDVLDSYKENIEIALLTTTGNSLAVDPYVWIFRQSLVSDLVAELSENQKKEMDELFSSYSTAFPKSEDMFAVIDYDVKLKRGNFNRSKAQRDFMMITSDTLVVENIEINYDSIRHNVKHMREKRWKFPVELDKLGRSKNKEMRIVNIKDKTNKSHANDGITIKFISKDDHLSEFTQTFKVDANFNKRMESYERMIEKRQDNNYRVRRHMLKYKPEMKDSANALFYGFRFYKHNNEKRNRIHNMFNEIMIIDSGFYDDYRSLDSISKFLNNIQFDSIIDMGKYMQQLQEEFNYLQFYDTSRGNKKQKRLPDHLKPTERQTRTVDGFIR